MRKLKVLNIHELINNKPFIVAEISANHQQSLEKALKLIDIASNAGADAVKFQTFHRIV